MNHISYDRCFTFRRGMVNWFAATTTSTKSVPNIIISFDQVPKACFIYGCNASYPGLLTLSSGNISRLLNETPIIKKQRNNISLNFYSAMGPVTVRGFLMTCNYLFSDHQHQCSHCEHFTTWSQIDFEWEWTHFAYFSALNGPYSNLHCVSHSVFHSYHKRIDLSGIYLKFLWLSHTIFKGLIKLVISVILKYCWKFC